jgi:hypothetical protein
MFGEFDLVRKQYVIADSGGGDGLEEMNRCYFMCDRVKHEGLSTLGGDLGNFLSRCEQAGLKFDSMHKMGAVLLPYSSYQTNIIGLLVIGDSKSYCKHVMSRSLSLLESVLSPKDRISEMPLSDDEKSSLMSIVKNLSP